MHRVFETSYANSRSICWVLLEGCRRVDVARCAARILFVGSFARLRYIAQKSSLHHEYGAQRRQESYPHLLACELRRWRELELVLWRVVAKPMSSVEI